MLFPPWSCGSVQSLVIVDKWSDLRWKVRAGEDGGLPGPLPHQAVLASHHPVTVAPGGHSLIGHAAIWASGVRLIYCTRYCVHAWCNLQQEPALLNPEKCAGLKPLLSEFDFSFSLLWPLMTHLEAELKFSLVTAITRVTRRRCMDLCFVTCVKFKSLLMQAVAEV